MFLIPIFVVGALWLLFLEKRQKPLSWGYFSPEVWVAIASHKKTSTSSRYAHTLHSALKHWDEIEKAEKSPWLARLAAMKKAEAAARILFDR